jgi:hypothetical protein
MIEAAARHPISRYEIDSYVEKRDDRAERAEADVLQHEGAEALHGKSLGELAGAEIHKLTGVGTGTLYPILLRFEAAGWLGSRWETIDPKEAGRPRKRLYRLTPNGLARASAAFGTFGMEAFA